MNNDIIGKYIKKYNLNSDDQEYLLNIINPIYNHFEFQKRMTSLFLHHGSITLGQHILEDTVLTYKLSKEKKEDSDYRIDLAVKIAMLHDLYTIPWQNNKEAKVKHFFDKHGFRHPIEAVINSISWYLDIFKNIDESEIIIDGILHHMFPLPVSYLNELTELKNRELYENLNDNYKLIINNSLRRKKIGPVSLSHSKYKEGRIMAKADKKVSRKQIKDFSSAKALITGHNKKISK